MIRKILNVAVIDDGINENVYDVGPLIHDIEITRELRIRRREPHNSHLPTHGTICAAIIKKYAPDILLSSVRILDDECRGVKNQLIKAIEWCLEKKMDVVNLSLGTIHYKDFDAVKRVINEVSRKRLIIVASCHNHNVYTCPASFSSVIGVKSDRSRSLEEGQFIYNPYPFDGIEITACAAHYLKDIYGGDKHIYPSNSYAAPLITAEVCNLIQTIGSSATIKDIRLGLHRKALNSSNEYDPHFYKNIDWVEKAQVFYLASVGTPVLYNKFCFETVDSLNIQCNSAEDGFKEVINRLKSNNVDIESIDTIVVVLVDRLNGEATGLYELYEYCLRTNCNLVIVGEDNCIKFKELKGDIKTWYPSMYESFYDIKDKKIKNCLETPIVTIYNFSEKNIIRLLFLLQSLFRKNGYYCITISDLNIGVLYDLEMMPQRMLNKTGINANLVLQPYIDTYCPDIIVIGINDNSFDFERLEARFNPDIRLMVLDDTTDIDSLPVVEEKFENTIVVTFGDIPAHNIPWKNFNCCNSQVIKELYHYIIELFENKR